MKWGGRREEGGVGREERGRRSGEGGERRAEWGGRREEGRVGREEAGGRRERENSYKEEIYNNIAAAMCTYMYI